MLSDKEFTTLLGIVNKAVHAAPTEEEKTFLAGIMSDIYQQREDSRKAIARLKLAYCGASR